MIKGIGVDIVKIDRFKNSSESFIKRILSAKELEVYENLAQPLKIPYLAKRFAAKEALCKAMNIANFNFSDYSILNYEDGKPYIAELSTVKISISDESDNAIAFVIIEE